MYKFLEASTVISFHMNLQMTDMTLTPLFLSTSHSRVPQSYLYITAYSTYPSLGDPTLQLVPYCIPNLNKKKIKEQLNNWEKIFLNHESKGFFNLEGNNKTITYPNLKNR